MTGRARMGARVAVTSRASAAVADTSCDTLLVLGPCTRVFLSVALDARVAAMLERGRAITAEVEAG